jgi:hypothetical protein
MRKIWFGLAFAAIVVNPASTQDYRKNWIECAKELGWQPDMLVRKLSDGRTLQMWTWQNEAQQATFNDCVARKASLASKPSAKGQPRVSH